MLEISGQSRVSSSLDMSSKIRHDDQGLKKIKSLAAKWQSKQSASFKPSYVQEVYQLITQPDCLKIYQLLYNTCFFSNFLWKFYHEDITNNHLELILLIAVYEIENEDASLIIEQILDQDTDRFDLFLKRILVICLNANAEYHLRRSILLFITKLVTAQLSNKTVKQTVGPLFDISILSNLQDLSQVILPGLKDEYEDCIKNKQNPVAKLKQRWLYGLITDFMKSTLLFDELSKHEQVGYLEYLRALLLFLTSLVSQLPLRIYSASLIREVQFASCFDKNLNSLDEYIALLNSFLHYPVDDFTGEIKKNDFESNFETLQAEFFSLDSRLAGISAKPSIHNYEPEELVGLLDAFSSDTLQQIMKNLGLSRNISPNFLNRKGFLINVLMNYVSPRINSVNSSSLYAIGEKNVIDPFINDAKVEFPAYLPLPLIKGSQFLSIDDFIQRHVEISLYEVYKDIFANIERSITSINVIDAPLRNYKGTSKSITAVYVKNSKNDLEIDIKHNNSFRKMKDQKVILMELQNRNASSPHARLKKLGISLIRLGRVMSQNEGSCKVWIQEADRSIRERFNFMIKLDEETLQRIEHCEELLKRLGNDQIPLYMNQLFLGYGSAKKSYSPLKDTEVTLTGVDLTVENAAKRQKQDDSKKPKSQGPFKVHFLSDGSTEISSCKTILPPQAGSLDQDQTSVLLKALGHGVTLVTLQKNPIQMIKRICDSITVNFEEKNLVVVGNDEKLSINSLDWVQLSDTGVDKYLRYAMEQNQKYLDQVEHISKRMNLGDFGYHQSNGNAILLYHSHIQPRWKQFVRRIQDNLAIEDWVRELVFLEQSNDLENIIRQYISLSGIFSNLQKLDPLVKLHQNKSPKTEFTKLICNISLNFVIPSGNYQTYKAQLPPCHNVITVQHDTLLTPYILPLLEHGGKRFIHFATTNTGLCQRLTTGKVAPI